MKFNFDSVGELKVQTASGWKVTSMAFLQSSIESNLTNPTPVLSSKKSCNIGVDTS